MQHLTNRQIPSIITSKGQVTIPAEVRRLLGISTNDKVTFQITDKGDVLLTVPLYRSVYTDSFFNFVLFIVTHTTTYFMPLGTFLYIGNFISQLK